MSLVLLLLGLTGAAATARAQDYTVQSGLFEEDPIQEQELPDEEVDEEQQTEEGDEDLDATQSRLDRISFQVPFPEEKGGGTAVGTAGHLEYVREDYVVLSGGVELRFREYLFQGEKVAVDLKAEQITAEGDVIFDEGPKRLVGDTMFFDLATETGTLTNAKAYVDPDIFFEGKEVTKLGEERYRLVDGMVTSCLDKNPDWNMRVSRGEVQLEGYAKSKNARFRIKKAPIFYFPYIAYPAKTERQSGFLFPNVGYSNQRGAVLGLAYFQTLGRSYDTTFLFDAYSKEYFAVGNEFRYQPSENTAGHFEGQVIDDPNTPDLRWKVFYTHTSNDLPGGLQGVIRYQDFSDFDFFRDFERDFNNVSIRRLISSGYLTGSWGQQSLNVLLESNETFIVAGDTQTNRQLPEVQYNLRATQIWRLPVYLNVLSSGNYINTERTDRFNRSWGRFDIGPNDRETNATTGESLTRTVTTASGAIVGPSFSRVFNGKVGAFSKFKHIIEPRWNYGYVSDYDRAGEILQFDEVDRVQGFNVFSYNFINRLLAKRDAGDGVDEGAREIMSLEISQFFSLDDDKILDSGGVDEDFKLSTTGPISARYRFNPSQRASLEAKIDYSVLFNQLTSASITGGTGIGKSHSIGLTWFTSFDRVSGDTQRNQIRLYTGIGVWPNRFRVDAQINYDFERSYLQSQRYVMSYFSQCFGIRLELREYQPNILADKVRDFRFAITLKNIGTFLDLSGGSQYGFNPGF
ncbi:MAG: putative LPS assembly protein LptD [Acidobacteriota bacterium]